MSTSKDIIYCFVHYSCAPFGGRHVPYSHSLLRYIWRALLKFGERTLATASSDDFFPDLGNLFLNDTETTSAPMVLLPLHRMCFCPSCSKSW